MGRIRTVKPDFFRHELLQELEQNNPKLRPMLVFAGLWTCCDKAGRFEWKPRSLKLDILPFVQFHMDLTLDLLRNSGLIEKYEVDGNSYGFIPTFVEHQRITGKEKDSPGKYPEPTPGNIGEVPGKHPDAQEGKGKGNKEGKGECAGALPPDPDDEEANVPDDTPAAVLGNFILQRLSIPHSYRLVVKFADAVDLLARDEKLPRGKATQVLLGRARDNPPKDGKWPFWLEDGGWKQQVAAGVSIEGLE